MFYIIYCTVHIPSNNIYIGMHKTDNIDDDYMGSGRQLQQAIDKHGLHEFEKNILHVFETEEEMVSREIELVTEEFCSRDDTYNLCPGGKGGWGYINSALSIRIPKNQKAMRNANISMWKTDKRRIQHTEFMKKRHAAGIVKYDNFTGKTHTAGAKRKIGVANSKHQSGTGNSQYGSIWITDDIISKKIKKTDIIPEGWNKGRASLNNTLRSKQK